MRQKATEDLLSRQASLCWCFPVVDDRVYGRLLSLIVRLEDFAFPSRSNPDEDLSTRQYARLVDELVPAIGLREEEYGTHSLRLTKASLIYQATGNLRAVQILLGRNKIENTVRYLGVDVEDALELAEHTEV